MTPLKTAALPSISVLPSTDRCFVQAVDDVALIAGGLIASVDAAMLAIAVPSDRWDGDLPVIVWNQRLTSCPARARMLIEQPVFAAAFDALCLAADALFARLETWGWDAIDAPGLCVVTDGAGVFLSTERPPAKAGCGWLLDVVRSQRAAVAVRAPAADGLWSLIATESATLH